MSTKSRSPSPVLNKCLCSLWLMFFSPHQFLIIESRRINTASAVMQDLYQTLAVERELSQTAKLSIYQSTYILTLPRCPWAVDSDRKMKPQGASGGDEFPAAGWLRGVDLRDDCCGRSSGWSHCSFVLRGDSWCFLGVFYWRLGHVQLEGGPRVSWRTQCFFEWVHVVFLLYPADPGISVRGRMDVCIT